MKTRIFNPKPKLRTGFTLIELLVVIAIIAILAAILFPVFARARENARRASCQSNLKQMGLAFIQYTQDYDEKWPAAWVNEGAYQPSYNAVSSVYSTWADRIYPYTKSLQLYQCPSRQFSTQSAMSYSTTPFAYNYNQQSTDGGLTYKTESQIEAPSQTIVMIDGWGSMDSGGATAQNMADIVSGNLTGWAVPTVSPIARRHLDGLNTLFCDGHVKWKNKSTAGEWTLVSTD
jgi:prepilin-type N-terminal cleavage/methylation domain-containing protein/prepilin-type processing-associated H-X9-DG protein